ncbi:Flp family type IVb pilin [Neobacillus sp. YIM B02564]|uniref:Flp family type IVb pilin n=1 Tax=Neobacillus paridis TaxID=2803862 RepID=A0ABS1TN20_9BACI|nr:Flp family type IVb pilin [Neobacillus paridis]MBL4952124.1 Flp family type IVb pilin [Neobacillus paridis]
MKQIRAFLKEEKAQGMAEYGLIVVLIAIGVFVTVAAFRDQLKTTFENITNKFSTHTT